MLEIFLWTFGGILFTPQDMLCRINTKSIFSKISFFGLFWPCDLYEGHKAKIFHCLQNNFYFPSNK